MSDTARIYRVVAESTASLQPGDDSATSWRREVLYIGTDRDAARVAYHGSSPRDDWRGYGNAARRTVVEIIDDAGEDDFGADPIGTGDA
jgi:hypothetical protein